MATMYGVQRAEKYKRQDIAGIQKEATRTAKHYNNDVDTNRSQYNITLIDCGDWQQKINDTITDTGVRVRKDSVVAIGSVYTATGNFFNRQPSESRQEWQNRVLGYFKDCLDWHINTYCQGNRDLVLSAVIHQDETTLHLQTYSMPILDRGNGKYTLSAKSIMGNRKDYTDRVDSFYNDVSKKYGLERGERTPEGQVAKKHIETQRHKLNNLKKELTITEADKIMADIDKKELEQNMRIIESKNQKLNQEYKNLQKQMQQIKTEISSLKSDKEIYSFDKQALLMENKKLRETKHGLQSQIEKLQSESKELKQQMTRMEEKIKNKKENFDFWEKAVSERQDCCKSLNSKIDDLGEIYENNYEYIDKALQIQNIIQEEYPEYYSELQARIDRPVTNIKEFYVDDEEIEL